MAKAKLYEVNEAAIVDEKFKGQAALIIQSLLDRHPQTAQQVADDVKGRLETRQDPLRVVGFYLSIWKKAGFVNVVGTVGGQAPVPTEDLDEGPEGGDVVEAPVLTERHEETRAVGAFDYVNTSLKGAVMEVIRHCGDPVSPKQISDELNVLGRTTTPKQVSDTVRKLYVDGYLTRVAEGQYVVSEGVTSVR